MDINDGIAQQAGYQIDIDLGDALRRLESNPDFVMVFGDKFIEAFAITNTMLISEYDQATRQRTFEKMIARSHFVQFTELIKNDADIARNNLAELKVDLEAEDTEEDDAPVRTGELSVNNPFEL